MSRSLDPALPVTISVSHAYMQVLLSDPVGQTRAPAYMQRSQSLPWKVRRLGMGPITAGCSLGAL